MKTNGQEPIDRVLTNVWGKHDSNGLTKREYFAVMAMQGMASLPNNGTNMETVIKGDARWAVMYADELIKALNENI